MTDITLKLVPEIIIGSDTINRAGTLCYKRGHKILVVTEQDNNQTRRLTEILEDAGLETLLFDKIPAQATAELAGNIASLAKGACCDFIIGMGGITTQHTARLASVLTASSYGLFDLFDGVKEEEAFLPYIAIPTVGLGGDPFLFCDYLLAVDPRNRITRQIKCPRSLSQAVIFDPGLCEPLSGGPALANTLDGFCSSVEAYCSTKANFLSDVLLEQAISLYSGIINSIEKDSEINTTDLFNAGVFMSLGVSLSAPGIGTALAYSLNGRFPVSKPSCSAVLLPHIMEKLVASRPEKMAKAASLLGEPAAEAASAGDAANMAVSAVRRCMEKLSIPASLKELNLNLDKLVSVADAARDLEFVAFSPWTVASEDAYDLIKQAY